MISWIKSLFAAKTAPEQVKARRKRNALTLGDLIVLELQKGGDGTAAEIAARLNAKYSTAVNTLVQLAAEKKVRRASKRGREIVWSLA